MCERDMIWMASGSHAILNLIRLGFKTDNILVRVFAATLAGHEVCFTCDASQVIKSLFGLKDFQSLIQVFKVQGANPGSSLWNSNNMEVCRICLASDRKLYAMASYGLTHMFEYLTGVKVMFGDRMPQCVCAECGTRLMSMKKFKMKSEKAHSVLCDILSKFFYISPDSIKHADRDELKSNLTQKHIPTNQYDYEYNYLDTLPTPLEMEIIEIKPENEDYFDESTGLIDENPINHTDNISETQNHEGFNSDSESISSLDVPLQQLKLAKSKEKSSRKKKKVKLKKALVEPKIDKRRRPFLNGDLNESLFTITDLTFDEQMAEVLKRKDSLNYKNCAFKCEECFKGFLNEKAFSSHMFKHSDEAGAFRCDICKTRFSKRHALRKHITAHHNQLFSCNSCDYVTTHRQTARLHERWHNGAKYQCPHCSSEFTKFTTYMGHIRIKHPSDFVCELCGYSFISAKGIDLHKSLKHRAHESAVVADGPKCEECNVRFVSEEAYAKHLQVSARHKENSDGRTNGLRKQRKPRLPKDRASKEIKSRDQSERKIYKKQMKKSEGPIDCEQCAMQLEDSRAYHRHFRRAHPDKNRTQYPSMKAPLMCEQCGRLFQSYALLKDHRWTHTSESPFSCEACGKAFRMKQRLVAHRRLHAPRRAHYACAVCHKHFSTHSNRQRHSAIHTGLKPFKCELCGKGFKHSSEKRAHHTYVHLKKPWPKRARRRDMQAASASGTEAAWPDGHYTQV